MDQQSLKDKTVKGAFWSAADTFLGQGVTFIVGLVLARILSPEEYGLIGIVTIFTTVLLGVVDSGFSNSLIRKQVVDEKDYDTLFLFNLVASVLMYLLLYIAAPYIASFFDRPQLLNLVRVMGLLLIFQALFIVQNTILSRNVDFKTKAKASIISAVISGIVGIGMAVAGLGVWSLVGQQLTRQFVFAVCLWVFNYWRPKWRFSIDSLRYMWGFGWKLLVSGLLNNTWAELNKVVVSKFYSPAVLGQYSKAGEYAKVFSSSFTTIIQRVSYPVLAKVQDDKKRMVDAYRKVIKTTMFVSVICMFFMGAISEPLIYCLIGPKWHLAATYLPLICIYRSMFPLQALNLNMLQVQERTDIFLLLEIVKKIILLGPLFVGAFVGIYWMLIANVFTNIIFFFLNSYFSGKSLGYSSWMQLKDVSSSYGIGTIVALSVYFLKYLPFSYWTILPLQIVIGLLVIYITCRVTNNAEYQDIKVIGLGFIGKLTKRV